MDELMEVIEKATAEIDRIYFYLPIAGGIPTFKERVYCYELYHQMRRHWPDRSAFFLNAEVDKRAHPLFRDMEARHSIPDFLVHCPGDMAGNHALIEVKALPVNLRGVRKDIRTLSRFRSEAGYQRALYLLYGQLDRKTLENIRLVVDETPNLPEIEIWLHSEPLASAVKAASTTALGEIDGMNG